MRYKTMGENTFLTVKDIYKSFGEGDSRQEVLRGMDFTVSKGEFCVLLGPSLPAISSGTWTKRH